MKERLPVFVGLVLALMLISGILMGIFWLPGVFTYLAAYLPGGGFPAFQLLCGGIGAILFGILVSAFVFPRAMADDTIFTLKTVKWIKRLSAALYLDCLLLCIAAVWLIGAGERLIMPAALFVALIGAMVASAIGILSGYIARAAALKEEADLTL